MSTLIVAEHSHDALRPVTLIVAAAAQAIGNGFDVLVAGADCGGAAAEAAKIDGVGKVIVADNAAYAHQLPENVAALAAEVGAGYSHILAAHTTTGKNFLPRVAATLDVAQISDIIAVDSEDTFKRPIYAGNAIATVKSNDAIKVLSVRGTAYDPVAAEGGSGPQRWGRAWSRPHRGARGPGRAAHPHRCDIGQQHGGRSSAGYMPPASTRQSSSSWSKRSTGRPSSTTPHRATP